jgi:hypothetical protein
VKVTVPVPSQQLFQPLFNDTGITSPLGFNVGGYDHFYILLSNLTHNTSLPPWVDEEYFYFPFSLDAPLGLSASGAHLQQFNGSTTGLGVEVNCNSLTPGDGSNGAFFRSSPDGTSFSLQTSHLLSNGTRVTCLSAPGGLLANHTVAEQGQVPVGNIALEIMQAMLPPPDVDDGGFCNNLLLAGWIRAVNWRRIFSNTTTFSLLNTTFVACTTSLRVSEFEVIVDTTGRILNSKRVAGFSEDTTQYFRGNATEPGLMNEAINLVLPPAPGAAVDYTIMGAWHNTSYASDWINSLLAIMQNSQDLVDPSSVALNGATMAHTLKRLYQELFSVSLALTASQVFPEADDSAPFSIEATVVETRLFVSPAMFKISFALLIFHFVVAILYYVRRPKKFLPRMPTSIAAVISYIYASRALEDFGNSGVKGDARHRGKYAFGRFVGPDGKTHIGIERQRHVVSLESENIAVKRRIWRLRRKTGNERLSKVWI